MKDYQDSTYGQRIAGIYDELYAGFDPAMIELLSDFASQGSALELGIGTGRVAIPLQEKGVLIHGVDASEAMISVLRTKTNGDKIEVLMSSFADFEIDKHFNLIYIVANTFFALLTQKEQIQCFRSVKQHLSSDGVFVLEVFVPEPGRFINHQTVRTSNLLTDRVDLEVSSHDPVSQQVTSQHVMLSEEGIHFYPVKLRYAWPSELDLMAQIAGLSLRHRWGSWLKAEFSKDSQKHISVYGLLEK